MKDKKNKDELKKTLKVMQDYSENIKKTLQNLIPEIPKIKIPEFYIPEISKIEFPDVIKEKNAWKRHSELMEVQNTIITIQEKILKEQRSTSKMTFAILILTIIAILVSVVSILKSYGII
ncbi:hypothetical protein J7J90_01705 [Candidatus Micrarchaeota archaeon]|nr:hypothetical protein [Candidatus Micrarchaeota archaeon]